MACELLSKFREGVSTEALSGGSALLKSEEEFFRGIYIAVPKRKDDIERLPTIPPNILNKKRKDKTLKDI